MRRVTGVAAGILLLCLAGLAQADVFNLGNRPLEVRYHSGLGIVAYASEAEIVDAALARDGWQEVPLDHCEGLIVHAETKLRLERREFQFGARTWERTSRRWSAK